MLTQNDFQTHGYIVSGNGQQPPEVTYGNTPHHRLRKTNYYGHTAGNSNFPGLMQINITAGTDTIYLPYYQSQVSSVRLPTNGPSFFVTDNMSGCAFYIAKGNANDLVVFHANSQLGSDQATMVANPPSFQSRHAANELDTLVKNALPNHSGGLRVVYVLSKAVYLANIVALASNGSEFLGGTTIAGWRTGTNWEFWFQNWGTVRGGATRLLRAKKFYG
jgi:hypothetical protein